MLDYVSIVCIKSSPYDFLIQPHDFVPPLFNEAAETEHSFPQSHLQRHIVIGYPLGLI